MRPDLGIFTLAALSAAGCARAQEPATANQAQPAAAVTAPASPAERAQQLVARRLGGGEIAFADAQVFTNDGATVVCGRYSRAGQPAQRFMAVGEEDVFVEGEFVGDMDQAVAETCRNS